MSLYDRVADLPLKIEGYALERLARTVSSGFERVSTIDRAARARRERRGRGRDLRGRGARRPAGRRAGAASWPASGRSTPSPSTSATLDTFPGFTPEQPVYRGLPPLGLRVGRARPRAAPGRHVAARAARPRRRSRSRSSSPRAWASRRRSTPVDAPARALPGAALQARRDAGLERRADRRSCRQTGAVDSIDFKGAYKGTVVDVADRPGALPADRRGVPGRLARGPRPRDRGGAPRARRRTRTGSPGTRRSTASTTSSTRR